MPFIHVKSLPLDSGAASDDLVVGIVADFAAATGIGLEHVTATWEFLRPGHYAAAGRAPYSQPEASHPVLVDLLAPDFNSPERIETMLLAVAGSIAKRAGIPLANIFINHRPAHSGMVFDSGEVVRW